MEHWTALAGHPRRETVLLAINEHDNGWREPDTAPTVDTASGQIHDFMTAPAQVRQGVWPRGVERVSHDPWAAALVAQHAITVYERYRADPAWTEFFTTMERTRDGLLARLERPLGDLLSDYTFVRIGDLISLVFCNQWRQETYREWTFRFDGGAVSASPQAFAGAEIDFEIAAIELPDRRFGSAHELRSAIAGAGGVSLRGVIRA